MGDGQIVVAHCRSGWEQARELILRGVNDVGVERGTAEVRTDNDKNRSLRNVR